MIGSHASIRYNGVLRDVNIGSHAVVSGSLLVDEASIVSNKYAPVIIGAGVIIKKSIILSGSSVTGGANIEKCFVGQGVTIGKQFSAENCALFANTEVMLGEGLSLFAGPYTVSHHKASLLLGGMFSFYNAGSGTNISNHMYKLGPLHQGIVERGSKTGSSSYLLWPCRVGAYSVVVGKHFTNFDTSDFPFSYITEEKSKSHLYPAMNLFTVGTRRDSEKWPARDKRNDPDKLDLINFSLFNPYIAGKMVNAWRLLGELADKALKTQEYVNYKGIQISRLLLKTSRKFYEMALKVYIGGELAEQLETETGVVSLAGMRKKLAPEGNFWQGEWRDLSGLFAPAVKIDELTDKIKDGKIDTIEQVLEAFREVHKNYKLFAWNWCAGRIESETGTKLNDVSKEMLVQIINDWQVNATRLNCMILQDASKEFDATSRYSYGIDGDEKIRNLDFEAVRGSYEGNKFVKSLKADTADIEKRAARLLEIIKACN
jgi:hypothetical protein